MVSFVRHIVTINNYKGLCKIVFQETVASIQGKRADRTPTTIKIKKGTKIMQSIYLAPPHSPGFSPLRARTLGLVAALIASFGLSASAQSSVFFDFSEQSQFTNNFTVTGTSTTIAWSSVAGVGGDAGHLNLGAGSSSTVLGYNTGLGAFAEGHSATLSLMFRGEKMTGHGGFQNLARFGLNATDEKTAPSMFFDVSTLSNDSVFRLRIWNDGAFSDAGGNLTLADNIWYELEGTLTLVDASTNSWDVTANIFDRGADGTDARSLMTNGTHTVTGLQNEGLGQASDLFATIRTARIADSGQIEQMDNIGISVIPEPGVYALMAGLAGLALVVSRRRRG